MAVFSDPFDTLSNFQQALDAFRASSWLNSGVSGGGAYPPLNVFRKGDDFIIITELPGVKKSDLDVQVKGRTIRLSGTRSVSYPEKAGLHRRERLSGRFDRAVTMPVEIEPRRRQGRVPRRHPRSFPPAGCEREAQIHQGRLRPTTAVRA